MKSLLKEERKSIFNLFMHNDFLSFSQIEKQLKIRSNMVAYHLDCMRKEGLLVKKDDLYSLSEHAEKYIPSFSHVIGENLSPLPVALVCALKDNKVLLIKRTKRPYKGYWSLLGGKILLQEDLTDACTRLSSEKGGIAVSFENICSVTHEFISSESVKHSFFLFFIKASIIHQHKNFSRYGELRFFNLGEIDTVKIIPSDRWLLKHKLTSEVSIDVFKNRDIDIS